MIVHVELAAIAPSCAIMAKSGRVSPQPFRRSGQSATFL
jgi:hypothetical protein